MSMNPFNQVIVLTTAEVNKLCSQATRGCSVKRNTTKLQQKQTNIKQKR